MEQSVSDLRKQVDDLGKESRQTTTELQKYQIKEESLKNQLVQAQDRIYESREEIFQLKQDKEKVFNKLDHLHYENENLRSEVFMMKKILLEVEKRDLRLASVPLASMNGKISVEEYPSHRTRLDPEIEVLRDRPQRNTRVERHKREDLPVNQYEIKNDDIQKDITNLESSYRPRNRLNSWGKGAEEKRNSVTSIQDTPEVVDIYSQPAGYRNPILENNSGKIKKTGVRVSNDVNKSSQEANILTWGSGEPARNRHSNQLSTSLNLMRGHQSMAVSSAGTLRRPHQDHANLNNSMGNNQTLRLVSPNRPSGGALHESIDLGNRGNDGKLFDLERLIDRVR